MPRLLTVLGVAAVLGLLLGHVFLAVIVALSGALAMNYYRLFLLERWLKHRRDLEPPNLSGPWGEVIALVVRIYRRKKYHKKRLIDVVREFRGLTSALPDGIVVLGRDREIQWFNPRAARLLGLRRKIDYGHRVDNLVRHPEFRSYLDRGDFATPVVVRQTGATDMFLSLQMVDYGDGQKLLVARDVSREIRIEAMRKDFVANASHELRSPLTVISGYVDTLADDPLVDADVRAALEEMRRQSARMQAVVEDLIELSRMEAGASEAPFAFVDVPGMLSLMKRDVLARQDVSSAFELVLDSTEGLMGAESELHSVFSNLIVNAIKYTPAGGQITARWWSDDAGGHFSVTDTGVGIAAEHLPRLTERFYRVDPGRARTSGGSGLGLSIVKHALQRHGATLEIHSVEGQGSVFTCHFPEERLADRA
jgi:two-component system, OmpR family, phosphate regulon sensor histidine kinase PhoR